MATSGTATFNLDIHEIIEEAYERAGLGRPFSGNDFRSARRSLNLLGQDFSNRGINLWTVDEETISLTSGTASYTLPADTVSVLDHTIREGTGSSQSDLNIARMSLGEFAGITSKNTQGRPVKIYIERLVAAPKVTVWPVPNNNNYTLVYYRIRRIEDTVSGSVTQYDAPTRFLPAIISGLAYHLALKNPDTADRIQLLKQLYEEDFNLAATEDRDRSDFRIIPAV